LRGRKEIKFRPDKVGKGEVGGRKKLSRFFLGKSREILNFGVPKEKKAHL
jgi:hypothetical protein